MAGLRVRRRVKKAHGKPKTNLTYDVVCVGRPVQDTILSGQVFKPFCSHGVCRENLQIGEKINVDDASLFYGGNALNASVTFARQNLSVSILAQIGEDSRSQDIIDLLKEESIDQSILLQDEKIKTGLSTVIVNTNGERTILAYPGSPIRHQDLLSKLEDVETRWLYLSSLNSIDLLEGVLRHAEINQIKVAFNPGGIELERIEEVKKLLGNVDLLILNKEEAMGIFGQGASVDLAHHATSLVGTCIITDGPNGAYAHDGQIGYYQPISEDVEVVDRNGAGDAFASGVVAGLAWGMDLKSSLELGSRNSTSVVQHLGPQAGIIRSIKR